MNGWTDRWVSGWMMGGQLMGGRMANEVTLGDGVFTFYITEEG